LYRIATNVALNFLGKQKVRSALSFESLTDSQVKKIEDDPWFNGNELELQLSKAIQKLPQKQKAVFCLRYYQELSYEEISEIMGSSVGALKASYHFAYEKIKKELKDNFSD
ncbi:MAG: RNA polymerase sigma factor, partial [Bacteroidales bacterium]|nr:RNA polymerase sigma factor [Bacteroidales bacterium]